MHTEWELLVTGATVFDGTGGAPVVQDVAVAAGKIAARGAALPRDRAAQVIDGTGCWLTPGLVDLHTHYDLEVELEPGLPESVRHGSTTVVLSNCSLGLAFGNQRHKGCDPVTDCFARVENIPKHVLRKAGDLATWTDPAVYLDHLDGLKLGPNVVAMIPHSMLRVEVMGLDAAISREPTDDELARMCALLEGGLHAGYVGMSTDMLPFHYLANDPNRRVKIPTQHATYRELKALTDVLRRHDRLWQTTPPKDSPPESLRNFLLSSGRLHGRPLRVTAVAAMAVTANRSLLPLAGLVTRIVNSWVFQGQLRFQSLAAPFKVWAEGAITPIAEEIPALRELNELDLEDVEGRRRVLDDTAWQERLRTWWEDGKSGFSGARLKRWLRLEKTQLTRDLADMVFEETPVPEWHGESMAAVLTRLRAWQQSGQGARSDAEAVEFASAPKPVRDDTAFLVWLLRRHDLSLTWWTVTANRDQADVERIALDPRFLPAFADSGAHITNMAFYDVNLRALRIAQKHGSAEVSRMVHRLTLEPAQLLGIDAGRLDVGAKADLALIDPVALAAYDSDAHVRKIHRDCFAADQLVNRSDGVVRATILGGQVAWDGQGFTAVLGTERLGRCLRVDSADAPGLAAAAK